MSTTLEKPFYATGAGFMALRESLGMTKIEMAAWLGVHRQAVHRWETGEHVIGPAIIARVTDLVESVEQAENLLYEEAQHGVILVPRGNESFGGLPASAVRAIAVRLAAREGLSIAYRPWGGRG